MASMSRMGSALDNAISEGFCLHFSSQIGVSFVTLSAEAARPRYSSSH